MSLLRQTIAMEFLRGAAAMPDLRQTVTMQSPRCPACGSDAVRFESDQSAVNVDAEDMLLFISCIVHCPDCGSRWSADCHANLVALPPA